MQSAQPVVLGTPPTPPCFFKKTNTSTCDDSGSGAVAYPIVKAENNEVMKTIDPDQPSRAGAKLVHFS